VPTEGASAAEQNQLLLQRPYDENDSEEEASSGDASYTDSSSPSSSPRVREPERYLNLHNFVDMMRGRRDHVPTHDVSNEGEDFLEAIIGFFSSPFVSMWDTIHP
jgi:hypothetical protein